MTVKLMTYNQFVCDRCGFKKRADEVKEGQFRSLVFAAEADPLNQDIDRNPIRGFRLDLCAPCNKEIKDVLMDGSTPLAELRQGNVFFDEHIIVGAKPEQPKKKISAWDLLGPVPTNQEDPDIAEMEGAYVDDGQEDELAYEDPVQLKQCPFPRCKYPYNPDRLHPLSVHMARKHRDHKQYEHYRKMVFPNYRRTVTKKVGTSEETK